MILSMTDGGTSSLEITSLLNTKGLARKNGKPWDRRQLHAVLENRTRCEHGTVRYGDVFAVNDDLILVSKRKATYA
jgi:Recombinase